MRRDMLVSNQTVLEQKMKISEKIQTIFVSKGLTLAFGESCTGGALSTAITAVPGASRYFLGSIVAYSNAAKSNLLDVSTTSIEKYGAVSKRVAEEMANGTLQKFSSDYAVAVTGIAGPSGGTSEKPVGTVWAAIISHSGSIISWQLKVKKGRQNIINTSVDEILSRLLALVSS